MAPTKYAPFTGKTCAFIEDVMHRYHVPGISIAVVHGDETFIENFGHAQLEGEATTEDTLYWIGSLSKSFTAASLVSVLEELDDGSKDALHLKSKIASILPDDFVLQDDYATKHATLEDALCHMLGLSSADEPFGGSGYTVRDTARSLRHLSMASELREQFNYLNLGYGLIQHVIETLMGKSLSEIHQTKIFDPLGMSSTFTNLKPAQAAKSQALAIGYTWDPVENKNLPAPYAQGDEAILAAGGIISSVKDMATYLKALIHRKLPMKSSGQADLFRARTIVYDLENVSEMSTALYALGWFVRQRHGRRYIEHPGEIFGFTTHTGFFPHDAWGVAILSNFNLQGDRVTLAIQNRLIEEFLDVAPEKFRDVIGLNEGRVDEILQGYRLSRDRLYPERPNPALPLSLPLPEYAGCYHHPAYRTIEFKVAAKPPASANVPMSEDTKLVLHAQVQRLTDMTLDLEHVSGEFFIAWGDGVMSNYNERSANKARFTIDSNGKVQMLDIDMEGDGELVAFAKLPSQ